MNTVHNQTVCLYFNIFRQACIFSFADMWCCFIMTEERMKVIFGHLGHQKEAPVVSFIRGSQFYHFSWSPSLLFWTLGMGGSILLLSISKGRYIVHTYQRPEYINQPYSLISPDLSLKPLNTNVLNLWWFHCWVMLKEHNSHFTSYRQNFLRFVI